MAGQNRYLYGETNPIKAPVHGNVTIEPGDFVVIAGATQAAGKFACAADYYAYPISSVTGPSDCSGTGASKATSVIKTWFAGIAMNGSPNGVTNYISIAQSGIFRYPVSDYATTGTTIGVKVTAVTPASEISGGSVQHVRLEGHGGTTAYFGYCTVNKASGASYVDFSLRGKYSPGGLVT